MITVIGAVCLDVVAAAPGFVDGTSNPAEISFGLGGVACNIFRRLSRGRGIEPGHRLPARLVSVLGEDRISDLAYSLLLEEAGGADCLCIRRHADVPPPLYIAMMERGELAVGASQMDAVEQALTFDHLRPVLGTPEDGDVIVVDANLGVDTVERLLVAYAQPCRVVFEPISVPKAMRHRESLHDLYLMTPNEAELRALVGTLDEQKVCGYLVERRIRNAVVTRGARGTMLFECTDEEQRVTGFPAVQALTVKDTTGAGDMLTARLVGAIERGTPLREAVPVGMEEVERMLMERDR